ncbi:hypothetical protein SG34_017685 [Thalassomonas viridans]|uniref:Uncharacterized protein n=1 Tax=Thalassomonas viridans TaxID=137584 RepID=A0AAE9YYE9_9GAMM|nr:hypothetical protein [Thalassomonas viridans]WDE03228.1 hypothetical protein SG34_017685 [Thalassomonas viridans]
MSNPTSKIEEIETLLLTWKNHITSPDKAYSQVKDIIVELMNEHSLEYISDQIIDINWHVNRAYQGEERHLIIALDKTRTLKGRLLLPA